MANSVPRSFIELLQEKVSMAGLFPSPVAISTIINNPGTKCPVPRRGSCSCGVKLENMDQGRREDGGQEREMGSHHPEAPRIILLSW